MRRLKVLVSAYACNPLSTEASYPGEAILGWNLVKQLSRFHDLWVITRAYNRDALEEEARNGNIHNVTFFYLTLPGICSLLLKNYVGFRLYYLFWQISAFFLARRLRREFKFDAFHQITFNNDWMPSFIGALLPIPFIWGPVGGGQRTPRSLLGELGFKGFIDEFTRETGQSFWRLNPFRNRCVKNASAILVCNQDTRKKLSCPDNKVYFFPVNGILSSDLITQEELASFETASRNDFRVLYAGRLDPIKGLGLAIRAFAIFTKKYPESRFEIIGEGAEELRLRKLALNLGVEAKIFFLPWLSRGELIAKIRSSDVFVFPSFRDGGGAVVVEAMAGAKPVICLDTGGPAFHVQQEWGIKIAPLSPLYVITEIEKSLERLYLDRDLRIALGRAGRRRAEEFYLWDKLGDRLQEIYEEVL